MFGKDVVDSYAWLFEYIASEVECSGRTRPIVPGLPVGNVA